MRTIKIADFAYLEDHLLTKQHNNAILGEFNEESAFTILMDQYDQMINLIIEGISSTSVNDLAKKFGRLFDEYLDDREKQEMQELYKSLIKEIREGMQGLTKLSKQDMLNVILAAKDSGKAIHRCFADFLA